MTQLPVMPSVPGDSSAKQTHQRSESTRSEAFADPEELNSSFDLTLQISLQASDEAYAVPGWPTAVPLLEGRPDLTQIDGRMLPLQSGLAGKNLPLTSPESFLQSVHGGILSAELSKPSLPPALKTEFFMHKLFTQGGALNSMLSAGSTDNLLQAVDTGATHLTGQLSAQSLQGMLGTAQARPAQALLSVGIPLGQPGWDQELGERIQWMVGRNIQNAEVKLTPPHLGPLEIRISVQNDQANVSFLAAQAPTREALEAAIPRLREMLGEANLNLNSVDVGQHQGSGSQAQQRSEAGQGPAYQGGSQAADTLDSEETAGLRLGRGLVDDYV